MPNKQKPPIWEQPLPLVTVLIMKKNITKLRFQENSWQLCSTLTFFQILFVVLFALFVKYGDAPNDEGNDWYKDYNAASEARLTRNFACTYRT